MIEVEESFKRLSSCHAVRCDGGGEKENFVTSLSSVTCEFVKILLHFPFFVTFLSFSSNFCGFYSFGYFESCLKLRLFQKIFRDNRL